MSPGERIAAPGMPAEGNAITSLNLVREPSPQRKRRVEMSRKNWLAIGFMLVCGLLVLFAYNQTAFAADKVAEFKVPGCG